MRIKKDQDRGENVPCRLTAAIDRLTECLNEGLILSSLRETGDEAIMVKEFLLEAEYAARAAYEAAAKHRSRLAHLEELVRTDDLTGLLNRRAFAEATKRVLSEAKRYDEQGVMLYIDLDGFKPINDAYGHVAGDEVLKQVARLLKDTIRETDYAARLGGDEFAVLLVRTSRNDGMRRAETIDRLLNNAMISWQGKLIRLSASVGFQHYDNTTSSESLISAADDAMYRIKRLRSDAPVAAAAMA